MIIECLNIDEFNITFVGESKREGYDFAVVMSKPDNKDLGVALHVTREEMAKINGLIAYMDRIKQREEEENGSY